jgi:hypothetical protein
VAISGAAMADLCGTAADALRATLRTRRLVSGQKFRFAAFQVLTGCSTHALLHRRQKAEILQTCQAATVRHCTTGEVRPSDGDARAW